MNKTIFLIFFLNFTSVRAKIPELKGTYDKGRRICVFEAAEELCFRTYDGLREIAGK
jgi:hypothetical protein